MKSEAPHHRECPGAWACVCLALFQRDFDQDEDDELTDAYRKVYDPDWGEPPARRGRMWWH